MEEKTVVKEEISQETIMFNGEQISQEELEEKKKRAEGMPDVIVEEVAKNTFRQRIHG